MNSDDSVESDEEVVEGKKRKSTPSKWKRNVNKMEKLKGTEYIDYKGRPVPAKTTGPNCG